MWHKNEIFNYTACIKMLFISVDLQVVIWNLWLVVLFTWVDEVVPVLCPRAFCGLAEMQNDPLCIYLVDKGNMLYPVYIGNHDEKI